MSKEQEVLKETIAQVLTDADLYNVNGGSMTKKEAGLVAGLVIAAAGAAAGGITAGVISSRRKKEAAAQQQIKDLTGDLETANETIKTKDAELETVIDDFNYANAAVDDGMRVILNQKSTIRKLEEKLEEARELGFSDWEPHI